MVGLRAASMTGIDIKPLGYDNEGLEYWKFPVAEDLFICYPYPQHTTMDIDSNSVAAGCSLRSLEEEDKNALRQLLTKDRLLEKEQARKQRQQRRRETESNTQAELEEGEEEEEEDGEKDSELEDSMEEAGVEDVDSDDDILGDHNRRMSIDSKDALHLRNDDTTVAAADDVTAIATTTGDRKVVRKWLRLHNIADIRKVVDLLGNSTTEQHLKKGIVNALLLERTVMLAANAAAANKDTVNTVSISASVATSTENVDNVDEVMESTDENTTTKTSKGNSSNNLLSWVEIDSNNSSSSGMNSRAAAKKPPVEMIPIGLRLQTNKGSDIQPIYVIQQETVFDDSDRHPGGNEDDGGDEEEDDGNEISHHEYFTFSKSRKYFAISLINKDGGIVKMGNVNPTGNIKENLKVLQGLTVIYQIHREGLSAPLTYAPLNEAWTDHLYYFSTVHFKKSGRYTISFLVEGTANAAAIKPLIFPVVVEARTVRCGIPDALDRLIAAQYIEASGRQIVNNRKEVIHLVQLGSTYNELDAVRAAMLMVYLALPHGAMIQDISADKLTAEQGYAYFTLITEPAGWNDVLDQAWRGAVYDATTPISLMECMLLLEHYINKSWLSGPQQRLIQALPNPHFAVCCATYSAVALRVYSLDKALLYDKIYTPPRERRGSTAADSTTSMTAVTQHSSSGTTYTSSGRRVLNRNSSSSRMNDDEGGDDVDDGRPYGTTITSSRTRRNAAAQASERIKSQTGALDDNNNNTAENSHSRSSRRNSRNRNSDEEEEEDDDDNNESDDDDENSDDDNNRNNNDDDADEGDDNDVTSSAPQQWRCVECTVLNEARARSCSTCGVRKPAVGSSSSNSYPNSNRDSNRNRDHRSSSSHNIRRDSDRNRNRNNHSHNNHSRHSSRPSRSTSGRHSRNNYGQDDEEEEEDGIAIAVRSSSRQRGSLKKRYREYEEDDEEDEENDQEDNDNKYDDDDDEEGGDGSHSSSADSYFTEDNNNNNNKRRKAETLSEEAATEAYYEEYRKTIPSKVAEYDGWINNLLITADGNSSANSSMSSDFQARCLSILRHLMLDCRTAQFWNPVDIKNIPSYKYYIKKPMDLGTITTRVRQNYYNNNIDAFATDMRLVWSNCRTFNLEFSMLHQIAKIFADLFETLLSNWITSPERPVHADLK